MKCPGAPAIWLLMTLLGCLTAGLSSCGPTEGDGAGKMYADLQSKDPNARIAAMIAAANAKDAKAVPLIVECLGSDESDVRLYAYKALEKLTGQTMGYVYYAPRDARERAIERWREWLKAGRPANFAPATAPADAANTGPTSGPATPRGAAATTSKVQP